MKYRSACSRTVLLGVVLAVVGLAACERRVAERRVSWRVADPLKSGAPPVKEWGRGGDGVILAPARIIADEESYNQRAEPLPAASLLRVELGILPPVDCEANPQHNHSAPQGLAAYPERMTPEILSGLSDTLRTQELWIVPGLIATDSEFPVNFKPLAEPDANFPDVKRDPYFNLGPAWFGTPLRQAGVGRWVYFPATQDCARYIEAHGSDLPTELFESHQSVGFDGLTGKQFHPSAFLTIRAVTPVIARVVEVCPVRIEEREERLSVLRMVPAANYDLRPLVDFRRYTGQVTGQCADGERTFTSRPVSAEDKPWDKSSIPRRRE